MPQNEKNLSYNNPLADAASAAETIYGSKLPFGLSGRTIFRFAAVILIFLLINPGQYINFRELPAAERDFSVEYGIGGGYFSEENISEAELEMMLETFDAVIIEPDSVSRTRILFKESYMVEFGDNISTLAVNFGLNQDSIISINKITNSRLMQAGRAIRIPNQDGLLHTVRSGETLESVAKQYNANMEAIKIANELFSDYIAAGKDIFIPGARMDWVTLQEINGDLFVWPVSGAITSAFGYRRDPFNNNLIEFHNGIDIRGVTGTPVRAAMAGRVSAVGWDNIFGNFVIINHHSDYRTLYGHLSVIRTRTGASVVQGERIGDVGSTGRSTGPHLHFTVYKHGVAINPRPLMR